jgi:hypothetical protein
VLDYSVEHKEIKAVLNYSQYIKKMVIIDCKISLVADDSRQDRQYKKIQRKKSEINVGFTLAINR